MVTVSAVKTMKPSPSVSLFRRGNKIYAKKTHLGTTHVVSTGTSDRKIAMEIGIEKITSRIKSQDSEFRVSHLFDHFRINAIHCRPRTIKCAIQLTRLYLKTIGESEHSLVEDVFTKSAAITFQRVRLEGLSNAKRSAAAITANTILRSARQFWSDRMIQTYDSVPECIDGFKKVKPIPVRMPQYTVADKKESMVRIVGRCEKLRTIKPAAYLAYFLSLHAGLRRGELAAARWSWVESNGIRVQQEDDFTPKSGRSRLVPLSEAQVEHIRQFKGDGNHIIPGAYTNRYRVAPDIVAKIMREEGIKGSKSLHELRKYYGANVATQIGLFAAQKYLGHSSPEITSRSYADLIEAKPVEIKILA